MIKGLAGLRIAYAAGLLAAPGRVASPWIGAAARDAGGAVAVRALAARDAALSLGMLGPGSPRPWLVACALCDGVDVGATLLADSGPLPPRAKLATALVAGGSGLAAALLAVRFE
jgi:hypothetical protein